MSETLLRHPLGVLFNNIIYICLYYHLYIKANMSQEEKATQYVIDAVCCDDEHGYGSKKIHWHMQKK